MFFARSNRRPCRPRTVVNAPGRLWPPSTLLSPGDARQNEAATSRPHCNLLRSALVWSRRHGQLLKPEAGSQCSIQTSISAFLLIARRCAILTGKGPVVLNGRGISELADTLSAGPSTIDRRRRFCPRQTACPRQMVQSGSGCSRREWSRRISQSTQEIQ